MHMQKLLAAQSECEINSCHMFPQINFDLLTPVVAMTLGIKLYKLRILFGHCMMVQTEQMATGVMEFIPFSCDISILLNMLSSNITRLYCLHQSCHQFQCFSRTTIRESNIFNLQIYLCLRYVFICLVYEEWNMQHYWYKQ
jgi:hypothetical protein